MNENFKIDGTTIKYGDAEFTFYNIKLLELYERPEPNTALHAHKSYELHFLTKGEYTFRTNDAEVTVKSGNYLIIPPQLVHYSAVTSNKFESIVIQFQLEKKNGKKGFFDYFEKTLNDNAYKSLKASTELMKNVTDFKKSNKMSGIEGLCFRKANLTGFVYNMFDSLNGFKLEDDRETVTEDKSDILFLIDHMVTSRIYTLSDIAERTGYSTRNISRLILSIYKMPYSEMKRKYALDTAKKLLETEEYTIEKVAVLSGFKNASAMRNAFKKYENITPSEYKFKTERKDLNHED